MLRRSGLHYVIAPSQRGLPIFAGTSADRSRQGLGLPWPPEARFGEGLPLSRVPVPLLWRGLIQQRDGRSEWNAGRGPTRFADLLAAHTSSAVGQNEGDRLVTLAVPDGLSNFSQQQLLEALRRVGLGEVRLLWNPIALALSWLDGVGSELQLHGETDSLLVLNLGPGSFDCVALRLREETSGTNRYVVPVRRPGRILTQTDGFDLVSNWLTTSAQNAGMDVDLQAFWYALGMSEVWSSVPPSVEHASSLWYRKDEWERFPSALLEDTLDPEMPVHSPPNLEDLLVAHGLPTRDGLEGKSWRELLMELLREAADGTNVRGAVIAGLPFALAPERWFDVVEQSLGMMKDCSVSSNPVVDSIWNAGSGGEAIARGAAEFGRRIHAGLPTYFDTLPELDVYAATARGGNWESLVRESEVSGGSIYEDVVRGEFGLELGQSELEVYLQLHDEDHTSIRVTTFHFPRGPARRMPLDVRVEVRPVGGLAVVEMIPEEPGFLGGIHVYLDYEEMAETDELPEIALGWPSVVEPHGVETDYRSKYISRLSIAIDEFLAVELADRDYEKRLNAVKARLTNPKFRPDPKSHRNVQYRIVDLHGHAATEAGRELISRLSEKIGRDFTTASGSDDDAPLYGVRRSLLTVGAWLFGSVPGPIREYVFSHLENVAVVHAAGRIFCQREEVRRFFSVLESKAWGREHLSQGRWLTIGWLWSAKRILSGHEGAAACLEREQVVALYRFLFDDLGSWIDDEGVNGFAATLWLLLYLLRYRVNESGFLGPSSSLDSELGEAFDQAVGEATTKIRGSTSFLAGQRRQVALEILDGLVEFREFRGSMNIVTKLSDFDEE